MRGPWARWGTPTAIGSDPAAPQVVPPADAWQLERALDEFDQQWQTYLQRVRAPSPSDLVAGPLNPLAPPEDEPPPQSQPQPSQSQPSQSGKRVECPELTRFLPSDDHPRYHEAVVELIRVDLERRRQAELIRPLPEYLQQFASTFSDLERRTAVCFEEFRLRRWNGEAAEQAEYAQRYDVRVEDWPAIPAVGGGRVDDGSAARPASDWPASDWPASDRPASDTPWLEDWWRSEPATAQRLAATLRQLPRVGETFLDFLLVGELGRGALGRVFLARQGELAQRFVVLKITARPTDEPLRLARLQHTNIVPVYSVHRRGTLQAVCMPFLGPLTLADVMRQSQQADSRPRSGEIFRSTLAQRQASTFSQASRSAPYPELDPPRGSTERLRKLAGMRYDEAVVFLLTKVAEGLAFAHEHGVVHCDLKPANILLADDGEPRLLDFHLAADLSAAERQSSCVGGTLPYMAPEQLQFVLGEHGEVPGPAADVYSLGLVLFELLTGELPQRLGSGSWDSVARQLLQQRVRPAPSLRRSHRRLSPALAAVVARCLQVAPQDRYPTAKELAEDLRRHVEHRPLQHAADFYPRERFRKWVRRHPRLASASSVACLAVFLLLLTIGAAWSLHRRLVRLDARQQVAELQASLERLQVDSAAEEVAESRLRAAIREGSDLADRFLALQGHSAAVGGPFPPARRAVLDPSWPWNESEFQGLQQTLHDLSYYLASAHARLGLRQADESSRTQWLQSALNWNGRAWAERPTRAALEQRARILRAGCLPGSLEQAEELETQARQLPLKGPRDRYLWAVELAAQGKLPEARRLLENLVHESGRDWTAWFSLGNANLALGDYSQADACYTVCLALSPEASRVRFHRGLARLRQQQWDAAESDFDQVLAAHPDLIAARTNRALAKAGTGRFREALDDLEAVVEQGRAGPRVWSLRAEFWEALGNPVQAAVETRRAGESAPTDSLDWVCRGVLLVDTDPQAAMLSFRRALQQDPGQLEAWQNLAHVLAERLDQTRAALEPLQRAIELAPHDAGLRASRGVLHARLGDRDLAHQDAAAALNLQPPPLIQLQVACIFALTARRSPEDLDQALNWARAALRSQPDLAEIANGDPDLALLRERVEFTRLVQAAEGLVDR